MAMSSGTSTSIVWRAWTGDCTTMDDAGIWCRWTSNSTTSVEHYTPNTVWRIWQSSEAARSGQVVYETDLAPETPEQAQQRVEDARRREEAARLAMEQARREREAAEAKARELLTGLLSPEQVEEYGRSRAFHVVGSDGVRYRVKKGWAGNVEELDQEGRAVARLCIHPQVIVPEEDNLAAQKLLLEADAGEFRRIANRTPLRVAN